MVISAAPFISVADLSAHIDFEFAEDDPAALAAVDAACDMCRRGCGQTINLVENETILLDGTGSDALLLPQLPVVAVDTVVLDDETLVADDDYALNGVGALIRIDKGKWTKGRLNVSVTYDHGYPDADIPRDIRMVALQIASRLYFQGPGVLTAAGGVQTRYAGNAEDYSAGALRILRKYRRLA